MRITKGQLRRIIQEGINGDDWGSNQISLSTRMRTILMHLEAARLEAEQIDPNDESAKGTEGNDLADALMAIWEAFGFDADELFK